MNDEVVRSLSWVGLAVGIVLLFMFIELVLRTLTNRSGTPQETYSPRSVSHLNRTPPR